MMVDDDHMRTKVWTERDFFSMRDCELGVAMENVESGLVDVKQREMDA